MNVISPGGAAGTVAAPLPGPVLGVETSCDETGLALYDPALGLLGERLHSQVALHAPLRHARVVECYGAFETSSPVEDDLSVRSIPLSTRSSGSAPSSTRSTRSHASQGSQGSQGRRHL